MIILDATVLIAYLARDDPHHGAAKDVLTLDDVFAGHTVTLAEALVRGAREGRVETVAAAHEALGVRELPRVDDEARRLALVHASTGLILPDCCVLVAAEAHSATLATFDHRLAEIARSRGLSVLAGDGSGDR